jgi:D-tyrosyl-tRNA(Tyr) deacylase
MKAVVQRVTKASVSVDNKVVGKIGPGLAVLIGMASEDTQRDISYLVDKIAQLRIFSDAEGKFNISALEICGEILLISQFTLLADTKKGRRPSFIGAAPPQQAALLFNTFVECMQRTGLKVETGCFQAHMLVEIHNDGPVTIMLDSKEKLG